MKRMLLFGLVFLCFVITLTSCKKDSSSNSSSTSLIVGTWKDGNDELIFESNGSFKRTIYASYGNSVYTGTYSYNENTNILTISYFNSALIVNELTKTKLVLIYADDGTIMGHYTRQ